MNDHEILEAFDQKLDRVRNSVVVPPRRHEHARPTIHLRGPSLFVPVVAIVLVVVAALTIRAQPSGNGTQSVGAAGVGSGYVEGELGSVSPIAPTAPVDSAIAPVSRTSPSADAKSVFAKCNVDYYGLDNVAGMGKVADAHDVARYVPLQAAEPELQTTDAAWVVAFRGKFDLPRGLGWTIDPVCVVVNGEPILYLPNGAGHGEATPKPREVPKPDLALPPLAP
jgi:hypothetical protein